MFPHEELLQESGFDKAKLPSEISGKLKEFNMKKGIRSEEENKLKSIVIAQLMEAYFEQEGIYTNEVEEPTPPAPVETPKEEVVVAPVVEVTPPIVAVEPPVVTPPVAEVPAAEETVVPPVVEEPVVTPPVEPKKKKFMGMLGYH